VILGGYEVTSLHSKILLHVFPRADYFIKGYAEVALKAILFSKNKNLPKVLNYTIKEYNLSSPYLTGVINIYSKKIHWETKRGCPFTCGFCEWGNAAKMGILNSRNSKNHVIQIFLLRLIREIKLFRKSGVEEINILDGTFNYGQYHLLILRYLLKKTEARVTCQARLESIMTNSGKIFIKICRYYRDRIHLEFGLQTIHQNEMDAIGRKNNMKSIKDALDILKIAKISYEVSIIYAIPGQTVTSFIDTIEFLIAAGCKKIRAYPLSIPKNSDLRKKIKELDIVEGKNTYNVNSVISSKSFPFEQREDMDKIAERLNKDKLFMDIDSLPSGFTTNNSMYCEKISPYQWEIIKIDDRSDYDAIYDQIMKYYIRPTINDIQKEDFRQSTIAEGKLYLHLDKKNKIGFINDYLSGKEIYHLKKLDLPEMDGNDPLSGLLKKINRNLKEKKYKCKVHISKSNNFYVFREILNEAT